MPSLSTEAASFVKRIVDSLLVGPGYASASLMLGSGDSAISLVAIDPGEFGNEITVEVTVPEGTSDLAVTVSGKDITIALAVDGGTPVAASNTAAAICAAIAASAEASALVEASLAGDGTGSLSDAMPRTALVGGVTGTKSLPLNFLRAQDMATVLELLQDALDTGDLTATGGSARSVQDTGAFVADTQVGNVVVFEGNITAELAGVEARVIANTADELFFAHDTLPAAPAAGDKYRIVGGLADYAIQALRDGRDLSDAPAGNVYGDSRIVTDVLARMTRQLGHTVSHRVVWSGVTADTSEGSNVRLDLRGASLRIDQFKSLRLSSAAGVWKIVRNTEDGMLTISKEPDAPLAAGTAVSVLYAQDDTDASRNYTFAPGGQPIENKLLAHLIMEARRAVVAFTLPS